MDYYCYCNSNIKKPDEDPVEIYSDLDSKINQKLNITPDKIQLKNHEIFRNQTRLTYFNTYNDFLL